MGGSLRDFIGFPLLSETSGMGSSKADSSGNKEESLQGYLDSISIAQVQDYVVENGFRVLWHWGLPSFHLSHVSIRAVTLRSLQFCFRRYIDLAEPGFLDPSGNRTGSAVQAYHEILVPQCDEQLGLLPGEGLEQGVDGGVTLRETVAHIVNRLTEILDKPAARIAREISEMHPERGYLTKDPMKAMIFEQLRERRRMGGIQALRSQMEFLRDRIQRLEQAQAQAQVQTDKGGSQIETPEKLHVGLMAAEIGAETSAEATGSVSESISAGRAPAFASGFKVTSFNPYEIAEKPTENPVQVNPSVLRDILGLPHEISAENPAQAVAGQQPASAPPAPPANGADEFEKLRQLVRERWNSIIGEFGYKFFSPDYKIADDILLSLLQQMQNPEFASRYSKMERDLLSDCVTMRTKLNRLSALTRTTPMESFLQKAKGPGYSPVKDE